MSLRRSQAVATSATSAPTSAAHHASLATAERTARATAALCAVAQVHLVCRSELSPYLRGPRPPPPAIFEESPMWFLSCKQVYEALDKS